MATFEAQVEALTGLVISGSSAPTQTELTQFLTDGAKEILNSLSRSRQEMFTTTNKLNASNTSLTLLGSEVFSVTRDDGTIHQPCRKVPAKLKGRIADSDDMMAATSTDPAYYIYNTTLFVVPTPSSSEKAFVQTLVYPIVAFGDSAVGNTSLSGVTATAADPTVFTKSSHGLSTGDIVKLDNFTEMTEINEMTGTITKLDSSTFEINGVSADPAETTGGDVTELGRFPNDGEYLIPLYAAVKSFQNALSAKSGNANITTALTAINTELDETQAICDELNTQVDAAVAQLGESATQVDADVDTALSAINTAADRVNAAVVLANTQFDSAVVSNTAEDIELASSQVNAGNGFLSEATSSANEAQTYANEVSARISQVSGYNQVVGGYLNAAQGYANEIQTKIQIAQGYGNEVTARLNVISTEYSWMEKQQAKLQADYEKGLAQLVR